MRPIEKDEAAGGAAKGLRRRRPQEGPGETAPPPPADGGGGEPGPPEAGRLAGATGKAASATAARVASRSTGRAASAARATIEKATQAALDLVGTAQGLLASNLAVDLNDLMQGMVKGTATIYDKAMDATYIATHEGGANHRLFDGGHTLSGAFSAGHNASADDGIIQEALGTLQGLFRDGTTPKGLPVVTWDQATFEHVADALQSYLHIPTDWFYDLNTFDATELLGGTVGVLAMALSWNRVDTEGFAKLAGSMGLSSALAANPALLVVTVVALARAFQQARQTGTMPPSSRGRSRGPSERGAPWRPCRWWGLPAGPREWRYWPGSPPAFS